jgi:hypothetical protein
MPDRDEFQRLATEVRMIVAGIFDKGERETVLRFVNDCERRFGATSPTAGRRPARSAK